MRFRNSPVVETKYLFRGIVWRRFASPCICARIRRFKDGKEHRYWSIVESKRCAGGKVVQRQVL